MPLSPTRLALLTALFSPLALVAKLEFATTRLEVPAVAGADKVEATFRLRNTGDRAVEVVSTRADCGCTVPHMEQRRFAPGEEGSVSVVFTIGERTGRQEKRVQVETDDGQPATELLLVTEIPLTVGITPQILIWNLGEAPDARGASVQLNEAAGIRIARIEMLGEGGFTHELQPTETPGTQRLVVTPQGTAERRRARLDIYTTQGAGGPETRKSIYLSVR